MDRGHDSRGVIQRLLDGPPPGFEQVCLIGNHEAWLLDFLQNTASGPGWLMNGGAATLASYGVQAGHGLGASPERLTRMQREFAEALPAEHLAFLEELELYWAAGDYAFVHAGIRPGAPLDRQREEDLLWIRDDFLYSNADFGPMIVHGHTVTEAPEQMENRIGIDTGAFMSGRLTCLALEGSDRRFIQT